MATCSYDIFSDSDSEEQFEGFAREDITEAERNIEDYLGENDISVLEVYTSLSWTSLSSRNYWSKNKFLGVREVQDVMSRNRYLKINQYLHFNDSDTAVPQGEANHDKLHQLGQ